LQDWTAQILEAAGLRSADAQKASDIFMRASLRGLGHHDISYLPQRLDWLKNKGVNPRPELRCFNSGAAFENWDGDCGLGELGCRHITERAILLAQDQGLGFATVRRSNHFLAAAPYTELGVEAGCLLIVWSNTDAGMSSPEGIKNFIGNNPMGFGVASGDAAPVTFDSCMAYSSLGNLKALKDSGQTVPSWWGVDAEGGATDDPGRILNGGSVKPLGGHKGFGLALLGEFLTGLLGQGTLFDEVVSVGGINTHNQAVIAFKLDAFGGRSTAEQNVKAMLDRMRAKEAEVRIPGERSFRVSQTMKHEGISLSPDTYTALCRWSELLQVSLPKV